jgi:hypothetical protein
MRASECADQTADPAGDRGHGQPPQGSQPYGLVACTLEPGVCLLGQGTMALDGILVFMGLSAPRS